MATTFDGKAERTVHTALEHYATFLLTKLNVTDDEDEAADLANELSYMNVLIRTIVADQHKVSLIRTDDNGNETVMFDNLERDDARVLYRIMTTRGHKQCYEIRRMR